MCLLGSELERKFWVSDQMLMLFVRYIDGVIMVGGGDVCVRE
jgi:hypothetical protein